MRSSPRFALAFVVAGALASGAAFADTVVTRDGKTFTGDFRYSIFGVDVDPQNWPAWHLIRKVTDDKGAVLYEGPETSPAEGEKGALSDAGEIRGSLYVNPTLGFSIDVPSGKDVRKRIRTLNGETTIDGLDVDPRLQILSLLTVDVLLDTDKIKNKAMLEVFQSFPNRVFVVAHTGFAGLKSDAIPRRMAEDEVKHYVKGWLSAFLPPEVDPKENPPAEDKLDVKAKDVTLGGQKALFARGEKTEERRGRVGGGKFGRTVMKRQREVEVTVVQRGDVLVLILAEIAAPDDLVESLRLRLRKIVGSISFEKKD